MFTQGYRNSPICFFRRAGVAGGISSHEKGWPYNSPGLKKKGNTTDIESVDPEKTKQRKVLGPLIGSIIAIHNGQAIKIISLIEKKSEEVIRLAGATEIIIDGKKTTVLMILATASMGKGSWSVYGYESIGALGEFAKRLTHTLLRSL